MTGSKKGFIIIEIILGMILIGLLLYMGFADRLSSVPRIHVLLDDPERLEYNAFKYGIKTAAEESGVEIVIVSLNGVEDEDKLRHVLQREISLGAQGLIIEMPGSFVADEVIKEIDKNVPVIITGAEPLGSGLGVATIKPDNRLIGENLCESVLSDNDYVKDSTRIGVIAKTYVSGSSAEIYMGLMESFGERGIIVDDSFTRQEFEEIFSEKNSSSYEILIALDEESLNEAVKIANKDEHVKVYGVGRSSDAVMYLDYKNISGLIVPNEYLIGYNSIKEMENTLSGPFKKAKSVVVDSYFLDQENLFEEANQDLILTLIR